jgi:hypothetical protein
MYEPFQGARIGPFTVLAPSPARYLQLIIQSDKTPQQSPVGILSGLMQATAPLLRFIKAGWGSEKFSSDPTSVENEMSVIQCAVLCGDKIVLTGDAGRDGLTEAANYAPQAGLILPDVDKFQAPHHGGRRNLSSALLDRWVGRPLNAAEGQCSLLAISSTVTPPWRGTASIYRGRSSSRLKIYGNCKDAHVHVREERSLSRRTRGRWCQNKMTF